MLLDQLTTGEVLPTQLPFLNLNVNLDRSLIVCVYVAFPLMLPCDHLLMHVVASLMLASGAGAVKGFKAGKIALSTLEAALAAVKSNEVGRFLQDLIGSGTIGEIILII